MSVKQFRPAFDRGFHNLTFGLSMFVLLLLVAILAFLVLGSIPVLKNQGLSFFISSDWNPVTDVYGALPAIIQTLITAVIALVIGVPVSFGIAVFLTELSPAWIARPVGMAIELLAAIPSIIYGMWGLFVFAPTFGAALQRWTMANLAPIPVIGPLFASPPMGIGIFTAGIILAIMIVPFITAMMRDVFTTVPAVLKESAYGLGCTRWEVVYRVVLPYCRAGAVGAVMLGLGRALGETMAVTFVIGNSHRLSASIMGPGATISSSIANEFVEADSKLHTSALVTLGLTLFVITFIVLAVARLFLLRLKKQSGR